MSENEKKQNDRFIIGLGGGHRQYQINGVNYVVDGRFAEPKKNGEDKTLADKVEDFVTSDFADLTPHEEEPKIKTKPVRSTAGRER